jgi:hypothetical protein
MALFIILLALMWTRMGAIHHEPGVLITAQPEQVNLPTPGPPVEHAGVKLIPLAHYKIQGHLIAVDESYRTMPGDPSPIDFALGWQRMSDSAVLDQLEFRQAYRFIHYHYSSAPPIPPAEITQSFAHMHLIPKNAAIDAELQSFRIGALIELRGYLVEVQAASMPPWRSSMTRTDHGNGACEIMWVHSAREL